MPIFPVSGQISEIQSLVGFIREHSRLIVLTGAGCSTDSGIPEYRDDDGNWKHQPPMQFAEFVNDEGKRRRYWRKVLQGGTGFRTQNPTRHITQSPNLSGVVMCPA